MATRKLAQKVLDEVSKSSAPLRTEIVQQTGQILFVSPSRFKDILRDIFQESLDEKALTNIWTEWGKYLSTLERTIKNKTRLKELRDAKIAARPTGDEVVYVIGSYETIKKEKAGNKRLGRLIKAEGIDEKDNRLGLIGGQGDKFGAQLGHEEDSRGAAASAAKVLKTKGLISRSKAREKEQVLEIVDKYLNTLKVTVTHEQIFTTKGELRKKYVPLLTWQKAVDNQTMKRAEEAALAALQKELSENIATMEGSTPLNDALTQVLLGKVVPTKKRKGTRSTGKTKKTIKEKNTNSKSKKTEQTKKVRAIRDRGVPKSIENLKTNKKAKGLSPFSYVAMINKKLPRAIRKNMKQPALQNRTGKFASGVQVRDVNITKQGFPTFGYTYQKDPYQVFEVGTGSAPWATPDRDPRKLIDKSIREVAAELALGRFYTRRL